jgi:hypothetical protein
MKRWLHKLEYIVDKIIPYLLVILIFVIVIELGFHSWAEENHLLHPIEIIDYFIIFVFVVDLIFKYVRVHSIPLFLRKYWLEIIAVFPFFLFFRLAELAFGIREVSEGVKTAQSITHTTTELEREMAFLKEGEKLLKEGEKIAKVERSARLTRFLRPLLRIPRFFKKIPEMLHFYNKPSQGK